MGRSLYGFDTGELSLIRAKSSSVIGGVLERCGCNRHCWVNGDWSFVLLEAVTAEAGDTPGWRLGGSQSLTHSTEMDFIKQGL